jgi:hypothetical protein
MLAKGRGDARINGGFPDIFSASIAPGIRILGWYPQPLDARFPALSSAGAGLESPANPQAGKPAPELFGAHPGRLTLFPWDQELRDSAKRFALKD